MKVEQFFEEWISKRPDLAFEFHVAGIEAMAFADAYHKKQLSITNVVGRSEQLLDFVRWQNTQSSFVTIPESMVTDYEIYLKHVENESK